MTENINQHVKEKYLDLLAEKFDAEEKVATEIINLESIMELQKVQNTLLVIYMVNTTLSNMCSEMDLVT